MILLGLTGPAGSGKDTFADALFEHHSFVKTSFAAPLKVAAQAIFGFSAQQMHERDMKEAVSDYWGFSPREALQKLGTESVRDVFGPDTWIKRWLLSYMQLKDTDHVVVTDVRFDNEANLIRHQGGWIVHLRRPANPFDIGRSHRSEQGVTFALGDMLVENDGSLDLLRETAIGIVDDMLKGAF